MIQLIEKLLVIQNFGPTARNALKLSSFNDVRDIILTVSELQFFIRSRQVTTLHAISYCMICIYSPLQCQEGDCRTLACDVVFSAFV